MTTHAIVNAIAGALTAVTITGAGAALAGILPMLAAAVAIITGITATMAYYYQIQDSPSYQKKRQAKSNPPQ